MLDILNSIGGAQTKCKEWLVSHLEPEGQTVVLGGWYGRLAATFDAVSVDIDPECSRYGKMLFPNVEFRTRDAFEDLLRNEYDTIICTSCEHMEQDELDMLNHLPNKPLVCLQSNNWEGIGGHINCKETLDDFVNDYTFDIIYKGEKDMGDYTRWMLIGRVG